MVRNARPVLSLLLLLTSTSAMAQDTSIAPLPTVPQTTAAAPVMAPPVIAPPVTSPPVAAPIDAAPTTPPPSNDAILATLDDELASDIRALMEESPANANKSAEPVQEAVSPSLNRGQLGVDANGDPKQIVLSPTRVEEWKQQLIKVSGEWETSLFFSKKDVGRLQNALEWRQRIEDRSPNILQTIESYLNPETAPEAVPLAPLTYETFRLKSIVIDPRGGWTLFLNDKKLNSKNLDPEAELVPIAVNSRSATFKWSPSDARIIEEMTKTAQAMTAESKKALDASNRIAATIPESNINPEGTITFTLRPNQSFVPQHAAIYEGVPPSAAAKDTEVVQQGRSILGTDISPEEIMRKFPGTEEMGGMVPMLPGSTTSSAPASTLPTEVGNEFDKRNNMTNSLTSIISQTRGNVQRLQNP